MAERKIRCRHCGKEFTYNTMSGQGRPPKDCSDACKKESLKMLKFKRKSDEIKNPYIPSWSLDRYMEEMKKKGLSASQYADEQKRRTLNLVGRVVV